MREIHKNIKTLFEPHKWCVTETDYNEENNKNNETIFTIGNGYLGARGFFEEGFYGKEENSDPTTLINGIYEYFPYHHIWQRPGFPGKYHSIVNQANPFQVFIYIDDEKFILDKSVIDYQRTLYFKSGVLERKVVYKTKQNKTVTLKFERFAHQDDKHLLSLKLAIEVDKKAKIKIVSKLNMPTTSGSIKEEIGTLQDNVFDYLDTKRKDNLVSINYKTKISDFYITCAFKEKLNKKLDFSTKDEQNCLSNIYNGIIEDKIILERVIGYATNRDFINHEEVIINKVVENNKKSFEELLSPSLKIWEKFWQEADVIIEDDDLIQQGLRFSMMQIYQSMGKDGITNISANGLSGTGYSGHTFWDTELFIMPMYIYSFPEIAKQLIMYRYNILDNARKRAKEMDDQGALFSWNSINGEECGHVFEAVTAQYHINNDVWYAIYRYYEATKDDDFMINYGMEILFEISKCMAHRGSFIPTKNNQFCINVICGPDEYNPIVDNNMYTNVLTQKQLYFTLEYSKKLQKDNPKKFQELTSKCKIDDDEFKLWQKAADNMYIPYSKELNMYMQDDNFIYKDPIDIDKIPLEKLPLLTNLHPLNLWRYQVCKQADIVLLTFIFSDYFTLEERKQIFDYYEPKTIHDSSLSASIHSIVACDVGYREEAYHYLRQSSRMDLDNVNRNTFFGLHAACMGASWMMMINGYGGLRIIDGNLYFRPFIDKKWNQYSFNFRFNESKINIVVSNGYTKYRLIEGNDIEIFHYGEKVKVTKEEILLRNLEV